MRILVDADACPVKNIIIRIARQNNIPVFMFIDTSHVLNDGYSEIITVNKAKDSVDIAIANKVRRGDIVVTQDYGVAVMVLGKGARAISPNGLVFTDNNIDMLLFERHLGHMTRKAGGRTKGPSKRTKVDNAKFERAFETLIMN